MKKRYWGDKEQRRKNRVKRKKRKVFGEKINGER